ncbi:MAG: cell surface protein, partial [Alphaproteobacteria bacterium]
MELTVQPGESIQSVINNASSGDEIVISPGNYNENIVITKDNLVIRSDSENPEDTVITANNNASNVFSIEADNIAIMGLSIMGAGMDRSGIYLSGANNCTIDNNRLVNNALGIYVQYSMYNNILNNTVEQGKRAINVERSHYNRITNNDVSSQRFGIYVTASEGNEISENM